MDLPIEEKIQISFIEANKHGWLSLNKKWGKCPFQMSDHDHIKINNMDYKRISDIPEL